MIVPFINPTPKSSKSNGCFVMAGNAHMYKVRLLYNSLNCGIKIKKIIKINDLRKKLQKIIISIIVNTAH